MPVSLHEMMEGLSPERRARIRRRADRIIEASRTMSELRRALDVTQEAVARRLEHNPGEPLGDRNER